MSLFNQLVFNLLVEYNSLKRLSTSWLRTSGKSHRREKTGGAPCPSQKILHHPGMREMSCPARDTSQTRALWRTHGHFFRPAKGRFFRPLRRSPKPALRVRRTFVEQSTRAAE
ncbi:hypothetical protein Amn_38740 [Aminobacter sp. Y103A]|nr:hypothetical protein [Aminobacter sp. SS-2016]BBD38994.1 hypothetical protein Amn_38740 [Aminobacter sp. SS-2016]